MIEMKQALEEESAPGDPQTQLNDDLQSSIDDSSVMDAGPYRRSKDYEKGSTRSAQSLKETDAGDSHNGVVDPSAPFTRFAERPYKQYSMSNPIANWEERTPTTLFSSTPIKNSAEYDEAINFQRMKILGVLALWLVFGPLVFRYALGVHVDGTDRDRPSWGTQLDGWEQFILVILYLGFLGSVLRLIPVVCGRPSDYRSTKDCVLDGVASLGMCSPFSSEDDGILLRSMIGRTCTVFQTIGGRHEFQGLYVDTILNERRIKGEANRRHLWLSWMKFLTSLVDICLLMKEHEQEAAREPGIDLPRDRAPSLGMSPPPSVRGGASIYGGSSEEEGGPDETSSVSHTPRRVLYVGGTTGQSPGHQMQSSTKIEQRFVPGNVSVDSRDNYGSGPSKYHDATTHTPGSSFKQMTNQLQLHVGHNAEYFSILKQWSKDDHQALSRVMASASDGDRSEVASVFNASKDSRDSRAGYTPSVKSSFSVGSGSSSKKHNRRRPDRKGFNPRLSTIMSANLTSWNDEDFDGKDLFGDEDHDRPETLPAIESSMGSRSMDSAQSHPEIASDGESEPFYHISSSDSLMHPPQGVAMQSDQFEKCSEDDSKKPRVDKIESGSSRSENQFLPPIRAASLIRGKSMEEGLLYPKVEFEPEIEEEKFILVTDSEKVAPSAQNRRDAMTNANHMAVNGPVYFPLKAATSGAQYGETPIPPPRPTTLMEPVDSYARQHSVPDLVVDLADLVPMVDFLNGWLEEMEKNEFTYDYHNPRSALEKLFLDSPFMRFFKDQYMIAAYAALDTLYEAFTSVQPDEPDHKKPVHPDEANEVEWKVFRKGMPDWTVIWSFVARSRLRQVDRHSIDDPYGPDPLAQSTRIKPGAIVIRRPPKDIRSDYYPLVFFGCRKKTYKVHFVAERQTLKGGREQVAYLTAFPLFDGEVTQQTNETGDLELGNVDGTGDTQRPLSSGVAKHFEYVCIPLEELELLEKNRGKTGAMNFFNQYLRSKTTRWSASVGNNHPIQTFMGIVDARHTIIETDVFWNDALPYFSIVESTGEPGKRFGSLTKHSICITVQYPQYFTNVSGKDDFLDNSNSAFYTLWQVLRDCGKCICSSGSNTIWDISNPDFQFDSTTRSEDLATSQEYIPKSAAVYLPVNVAYAIAKKSEDYLDALYRWSAGPEEMLWPSFYTWKYVKQYAIIFLPIALLTLATFMESAIFYLAYLCMLLVLALKGLYDKWQGRMPLRELAVASVFAVNMFVASGNLMSVTWFIIFPMRVAMFGVLPFGRDDQQSVFWGWAALVLSLPTGVVYDAVIKMSRYLAPGSTKSNYDASLWRGAQLYSASFMFTLMACIAGTWSAIKALVWDFDLSMWASFTVPKGAFTKIREKMRTASMLSWAWWKAFWEYILLSFEDLLASFTKPTIMTRRYVTLLFLFQFACVIISTFFVNYNDLVVEIVVLGMCAMNITLMSEIAILLEPRLKLIAGYPIRLEYMFAYLGLLVFLAAIANQKLITANLLKNSFRLDK